MFFRFSSMAIVAVALSYSVQAAPDAATAKKPAKPKVSQAQVALKGAFPMISASDAKVKGALAATNLTTAGAKVKKSASFAGTVTQVYLPKNGKRVLLDFAADYKKAVVGQIDGRNFKSFPDLRMLKSKHVLVSGMVTSYNGQLQVELATPGAIRIIK